MCPAVPSVSGASAKRVGDRARREVRLVVGERSRVEQQPTVASAANDRRIRASQPPGELVRADVARIDGADGTFELEERQSAAAHLRRSANDPGATLCAVRKG